MKSLLIALGFFCIPFLVSAQYGVTGYINLQKLDSSTHTVSLYKLQLAADSNAFTNVQIATAEVGEDGYFAFAGTLFTPEDGIYKIQLDNDSSALESHHYRLFIHSNTDSLYFDRTNTDFEAYLSSNLADWEWRKLQHTSSLSMNKQLNQEVSMNDYVRDSLQILLVKLIGLKQLQDKKLLTKEMEANPGYYADLVEKLQASDLPPNDYAFLSTHYTLVAFQETSRKYYVSLMMNGLAVLLILGLMAYVMRIKKQQSASTTIAQLSKQEHLVQQLILAGKSNKEIAAELFVSVHTVKSHITSLYSKLGVKSRKELILSTNGY